MQHLNQEDDLNNLVQITWIMESGLLCECVNV